MLTERARGPTHEEVRRVHGRNSDAASRCKARRRPPIFSAGQSLRLTEIAEALGNPLHRSSWNVRT